MSHSHHDDDQILMLAEDPEHTTSSSVRPWVVVIVDDDKEVHQATRLALSDVVYMNRPLVFHSAYSAADARSLLPQLDDVAIILLDVVMETDNAGLELVRYIRQGLGLASPRIILRTGQPGAAPERSVIVNYDINDYKAKTELTVAKLFATVIAALRGYHDLVTIEASRAGLRKIIDASSSLYKNRSLRLFANGVLAQISALLGTTMKTGGILCTHRPARGEGAFLILAGSGRFEGLGQETRGEELEPHVLQHLSAALTQHEHSFDESSAALYLHTPNDREVVIYLETEQPLSSLDQSMLELFGSNISVGYDNLDRYEQLDRLRKMLEADVQRSRAVADCLPTPTLVTDHDGTVRYINPAFTAAFGYEEHEVAGRPARMLGEADTPAEVYQQAYAALQRAQRWHGVLSLRHKSGALLTPGVNIAPVVDQHGHITQHVMLYSLS